MTTALAIGVLGAALACPAHMLWQMRRGNPAACCIPGPATGAELGGLWARQQALGDQLSRRRDADAELHSSQSPVLGTG